MEAFKVLVFLVLTIGALVMVLNHFTHMQCKNNVQEMGREYRYDILNGCRIGLDDGTFIYWKMYRVTE